MATTLTSSGLTFSDGTSVTKKQGYSQSELYMYNTDTGRTFANCFPSSTTIDRANVIYITVLGLELNGTAQMTFQLCYNNTTVFVGLDQVYIVGTLTASSHGSNEAGGVDAESLIKLSRSGATSGTSGQYIYDGIIELAFDTLNNGYHISWLLGSSGSTFTQIYGQGRIGMGSSFGRATGFRIGQTATSTFRSGTFHVTVL